MHTEVLARYGNAEQKERWLKPLIEGKIRSSFAMTEFGIASSEYVKPAPPFPV
jgi:acyl-CoA dehydrogenase